MIEMAKAIPFAILFIILGAIMSVINSKISGHLKQKRATVKPSDNSIEVDS